MRTPKEGRRPPTSGYACGVLSTIVEISSVVRTRLSRPQARPRQRIRTDRFFVIEIVERFRPSSRIFGIGPVSLQSQ
jgi:hypothetical protein